MRRPEHRLALPLQLTSSALLVALAVGSAVSGCAKRSSATLVSPADNNAVASRRIVPPAMRPQRAPGREPTTPPESSGPGSAGRADLTEAGAVAYGTTAAEIIDTTTFDPQILAIEYGSERLRPVKEVLPSHKLDVVIPAGPPNDLPVGGTLAQPRTRTDTLFPGVGQTEWIPPDPALAVGPTHIVTTVNQSIAFYNRDGGQEYYNKLNNTGNPGFFEPVGAAGFTFDPKCFYDQFAQRFVVVALEVYDDTEAWITIAVSDDSDPHGVWYKYRTDAVITVGSTTFWWDYTGLGYDPDAYYVTGNLFGLNQSGWGGVGFRIFDKTPMLSGAPVQHATLRDGGAASVQVAQHFGANAAPYFVSVASSTALRVHAISDPLGSPHLASTTVAIPAFENPFDAPTAGGNTVWLIDNRIMNVHWRDGSLYAAHHISESGRNFARWYQLDTNDWPDGGNVTFVQGGNIDAGSGMHTWFPAIYSNRFDEVGVVFGASSENDRISINTTGRLGGDPPGTMGAITQVLLAPVNNGHDRWGDYYDVAMDPLDDTRFWVIGEYPESYGWATWISSFLVSDAQGPVAVADDAGVIFPGESKTVDVLANDYHVGGLDFEISGFDATSANGGTIALSAGSGPDGRDELIYTAPLGYTGADAFTYTITDTSDQSASASVSASVHDADQFRDPDDITGTRSGVDADYYALSSPSQLPDFSTLTPYDGEAVTHVEYPSTSGVFAGSNRANELAAVYEGFVTVPTSEVYTFYLESDDGSKLYVGNETVVDNDGLHGMTEQSGTIALKPGGHAVRVEFFENTGNAGLIVRIAGGGLAKQVIPPGSWRRVASCPGDLDDDGDVDLPDLATLLSNYNTTSGATYEDGDLDTDGDVDLQDLAELLGHYGDTCP